MTIRAFLPNRNVVRIPVIFACVGLLFFCQSVESAKNKAALEKETPAVVAQTPAPAQKDTALSDTAAAKSSEQGRKLVVYYFHTTFRCYSCNMIERLTKQAVEAHFGDQIKAGRVEMKVINVETPGNEHFSEEYKLYTKSVVLSDVKNGKETTWKNLDQVWTLLRDENRFIDYVKKEINAYL